MKKITRIFFEKMYWLLWAGIPFLPEYVLLKYHSALVCNVDGICFRYGHPILNGEGLAIVNMSIALLFPVCIWQLLGKLILAGMLRIGIIENYKNNRIVTLFGALYWLAVTIIPLLFWYLFRTFGAPFECVEARNCLKFYLPLDVSSSVAVLISCGLLWPMCFWKLFGKKAANRTKGP